MTLKSADVLSDVCIRDVIGEPKSSLHVFFPMVKFIFFENDYNSYAICWALVLNTWKCNKKIWDSEVLSVTIFHS